MEDSITDNSEKKSFIRNRTAGYFKLQGRRPRILITRFPPNGSERAVKSIATAFADMGFDVDINLAVMAPVALARIAAENDVHAIGIPCISSKSQRFITELLTSLKTEFGRNILVVAWVRFNRRVLTQPSGSATGISKFSVRRPAITIPPVKFWMIWNKICIITALTIEKKTYSKSI